MKEHLNRKEIIEKLTPVVENTAMRYDIIPLEISLEKEGEYWFLRIFIYSPNHPVNHKDCENITRGLGDYLDELIPFKYYLEISSPGLDRKLKTEREYVIFKGKNVIVKVKEPIDEAVEIKVKNKIQHIGAEKKFEAQILDYQKGFGLKILKQNTQKEHIIALDNLFSVKLDDINNN